MGKRIEWEIREYGPAAVPGGVLPEVSRRTVRAVEAIEAGDAVREVVEAGQANPVAVVVSAWDRRCRAAVEVEPGGAVVEYDGDRFGAFRGVDNAERRAYNARIHRGAGGDKEGNHAEE